MRSHLVITLALAAGVAACSSADAPEEEVDVAADSVVAPAPDSTAEDPTS